ncbi:MAG TPA: shikimate dehydrogenase [Candidatus Dormibacteraeota bacterium]|jgi:shikimate dehydrogenase|nr:shikimate dehydrogenase [Candidatus Dormibacteraeota bacterium]
MGHNVWLLGADVTRSLSPAMQNAAFAATGIEAHYRPRSLSTDALADAMAEMRQRQDILGANVTIPHKEAVIPLLDQLDPLARRLRAVNTISRRDGELVGFNTDVTGFSRALVECGYAVDGQSIVILGAGGAARAVAEALRGRPAELTILARDPDRARRLVDDLGLEHATVSTLDQLANAIGAAAMVVNATPADLLPPGWQPRPDQRVFDLRSRRSAEGRSMLLHQGATSFEIWTGRAAPVQAMRQALAEAIEAVPA